MNLVEDLAEDPAGTAEEPPRRPRRIRNAVRSLLVCLLVLLMVPLAAALYLEHRLSSHLGRIDGVWDDLGDRPAKPTTGSAAEAINILVVGTDPRSAVATTGSTGGAPEWVPGAQHSDTLMIVHIDGDRRGAAAVSIPRDTWVDVPGHGMNKVNATFSFDEPSLAIRTVEQLTGVRIDHLAVVDWAGFAALTDLVGGIGLTVPTTVHDSAADVTWTAGEHVLDGRQALEYIGQRSGLPRGDLDRVARQQVVLRRLLKDNLHQEMRKDPRMIYDFLDIVSRHLSVDSEWSTWDMNRLVLSLRNMRSDDIRYLTMPTAGFGWEGDQRVVYADRLSSTELWSALREDRLDTWASAHPDLLTPAIVS